MNDIPDYKFPDGYDLRAEAAALADLIAADNPDSTDPRWPRFVELESRVDRLRQMNSSYKLRHGAEALVNTREAIEMGYIGALVDDDQDSMTLHTREAYRLFMGRSQDANGQYKPIIGGRRVASALRSAWALSGQDNPYADWVLVAFMDRMDEVAASLNQEIASCESVLKELGQRGLKLSILRSKGPKDLPLGFRSPYGYAVAELIIRYDYFVRMFRTLIKKGVLSDDEGRVRLRQQVRLIRSMFENPPRYERFLMRDELKRLSRHDWLPEAGEEGLKRVQAVVGIFGEVPREIFVGQIQPRHSKRRAHLSEQELRVLQEVALSPADSASVDVTDEQGLL